MSLDLDLFFLLNNLAGQSKIFDDLIIFLTAYLQYFLGLVFLLVLFSWSYSKREKVRIFLVIFLSAVIARLGVTELIRYFYNRPRPFMIYQVQQLIPESGWSFPSGHSTFFFAMSTAIYFYNKKWGIAFFIASILMNVSRIVAGVHYPSDILGGAMVGIAVGWLIFALFGRNKLSAMHNVKRAKT